MRKIFENCNISAEIKLDIGSEITIQLYSLLNTQRHSVGDTEDYKTLENLPMLFQMK